MAYKYNHKTGNFDFDDNSSYDTNNSDNYDDYSSNMGGYGTSCNQPSQPYGPSGRPQRSPQPNEYDEEIEDISLVVKILSIIAVFVLNYITFLVGWGWLFVTVWYSLIVLCVVLGPKVAKDAKIAILIGYLVTMLTVVTPLPWWTVFCAMIISFVAANSMMNKHNQALGDIFGGE